ncbi:MAG: hypothetical protein Q8918_05150 [Bacteroidota bacterium]|nr:hypothetical protein [Bacteroidota bacterium]
MWTSSFRPPNSYGKYFGLLFIIYFSFLISISAQEKCNSCSIPAFAALTVYHTLQTGPVMGVGIEAGKWKKDAGKFSYFLGTEILWSNTEERTGKSTAYSKGMVISFYIKGQYKIANRFYLIAQPELVNVSYLEMRAAIRYVVPVTKIIGIGIEPGYSMVKKQWSLNSNFHFALP